MRFFGPFYRSEFPDDELIRIEGTWGVIEPGITYHWVFIRDSDHNYIASIVHDKDGNLVDFKVFPTIRMCRHHGQPIQVHLKLVHQSWVVGLSMELSMNIVSAM